MSENNKHHASLEHELFKHFPFSLVLSALKKKKNQQRKVGQNTGGEQMGAKGWKDTHCGTIMIWTKQMKRKTKEAQAT